MTSFFRFVVINFSNLYNFCCTFTIFFHIEVNFSLHIYIYTHTQLILEQCGFELHSSTSMDFFFIVNIIVLHDLRLVESMDMELWIWRVNCKLYVHWFSTALRVDALNSCIFQGPYVFSSVIIYLRSAQIFAQNQSVQQYYPSDTLARFFKCVLTSVYNFQESLFHVSPQATLHTISICMPPPLWGMTLFLRKEVRKRGFRRKSFRQDGMKRGGKWRFVCISIDGGKKWLALQATEVEECLIELHRNHYRINYFGIKDGVFQVKGSGPTVLGYLLYRSESDWSGSGIVLRPCQWGPALDPWFRRLCPNSECIVFSYKSFSRPQGPWLGLWNSLLSGFRLASGIHPSLDLDATADVHNLGPNHAQWVADYRYVCMELEQCGPNSCIWCFSWYSLALWLGRLRGTLSRNYWG